MATKELKTGCNVVFKDETKGIVKTIKPNVIVLNNGTTVAKSFIKTWY